MNELYLDIETVPAPISRRDEIRAELEAGGFKPPANIRDPEKIASRQQEWEAGLEAQADEAWRKTALSAVEGGRIICIGMVWETPPQGHERVSVLWWPCLDIGGEELPPETYPQPARTEADVLADFWRALAAHQDMVRIVGHNVLAFDLPYIWQRSVICGVRPTWMPDLRRYSTSSVYDTMAVWSNWDPSAHVSLDKLCRALGVTSPKGGGLDGSKVCDAWRAGDWVDVQAYCVADVEATREVYRRMEFLAPPPAHEQTTRRAPLNPAEDGEV